MASRDEYQQYDFSQELTNIDKSVDALEEQLNKAIKEVEALAKMGMQLKQHHASYKNVWKQHNLDKFAEVLKKAKDLDNIVYQNF